MSRRTLIADAIIATLAESGSRGLTHRAVDATAGLPVGSTSYYLRSRAALLEAAVTRLAELDTETLASFDASSTDPTGVLTSILQEALTGQGRVRTLARYELSLEAARRPDLRRSLAAGTAQLESLLATLLQDRFHSVDAETRARDVLAFIDGLLFAEITGTHSRLRSADELHAAVERAITQAQLPS